MAEQWIRPAEAIDLVGDAIALCARLHAGLIAARARLLLVDERRGEDVLIPSAFWWAKGHEALDQDWASGDFSTWIDNKHHWRAFGVNFALSGVLDMLPSERRGAAARSLSVAGNSDWVPANEARKLAWSKAGANPARAGTVIVEQAKLGFLTARAVLAQGAKQPENWTWEVREWDVAPWFWESFTFEGRSSQDWELGRFAGHGPGPHGLRWITLSGVHFHRPTLAALFLGASAATVAEPPAKKPGGRPPAPFADDLMCAVWGLIYQGDLKPTKQAVVERAILDWASNHGHELGVTTAREKARKVFAALSGEVENPGS